MTTRVERIELLVIVSVAVVGWIVQPHLPSAIPLWQFVLGMSALLLAQSLVRDVSILLRQRSTSNRPRREAQCFCLESSVGSAGIIAAALLAVLAGSIAVTVSQWGFTIAISATLLLGFAIKDLVISWSPLGLRREKDHLNLIVRWRIK
jgi:hypothetical protein